MLLIAALGKMADNRHFAEILAQWNLFPDWSLLTIGVLAILSELILSVWLFSGIYLAYAALATAAFHFVYTGLTIAALSKGVRLEDCGCFGIFFKHPLDWVMAGQDFGFALLALFLFWLSKGREPACTNSWREKFVDQHLHRKELEHA